jgi:hypothetical protein
MFARAVAAPVEASLAILHPIAADDILRTNYQADDELPG